MNFGENLVRSVSGSVNKAILCVKKPTGDRVKVVEGKTNKFYVAGEKYLFDADTKDATSLQMELANFVRNKKKRKAIDNTAQKLAEQKGGMFTLGASGQQLSTETNPAAQGNSSTEKTVSSIESIVKKSGYHIFRVKYNPSKIQIESRAGSFLQPGPGGPGTNTLSQITMPTQTYMNFEILLDEENHQDAFMFDKVTNLSIGAGVSDIAGIVKNLRNDEGYTVRPLVEALIGILTQSETRQVVFFWSEMAFAGEVVSIDARYTMFNPIGNPIRAVVKLTILQGSEEQVDETYWNNAFDNMGEGGNWQSKVNNLLNFR